MKLHPFAAACWTVLALPAAASAAGLPRDVPPGHWAATSVQEVLDNHVMSLAGPAAFHGEQTVTRRQAVIAMANLARDLQKGTWHAAPSVSVIGGDALAKLGTAWRSQPLNRYALATILARMGDYFTNGVPRPAADAKDLGKSAIIPPAPKITAAPSNPAYSSLVFLASNRFVWPKSPLLAADNRPVTGGEMSRGLTEMVISLNNQLTPLGHDEQGGTIDVNSHRKQPKR